jgi:serine protease inhibitor
MVSGMKECGMRNIFESEASDFTPLTDLPNCHVSSAHQTMRVQVSEWGCKATGYTEIMIYCGAGIPDQMKEFYANRPFAFEIISCTGTPLFAGVVYSPGKF